MQEIKSLKDIQDLASILPLLPKNVFIEIRMDAESYRNLHKIAIDMVCILKHPPIKNFQGVGLTIKGINFKIIQIIDDKLI